MTATNKIAFVLGDSNSKEYHSGLQYVARNLETYLRTMGYKTVYISISGPAHPNVENSTYYIGNGVERLQDGRQVNSVQKFDELVKKYRPSVVVTNHDLWMSLTPMLSAYRHTYTWIQYNPIEANYYPKQVIYSRPDDQQFKQINISEVGKNADYIIAYNDFGASGLRAMGVDVDKIIPNGIDRNKGRIITDQEVINARRAVLGVNSNEVLFMHMSRNSPRKRQDVLLEAWYKFLKMGEEKLGKKPAAKLYLHSDRYSLNGLDIPSITERFGITDSVIMPSDMNFSDDDLNMFYNACDVYVSLPGGEGHGYGFHEAMAIGKPLIYGAFGGHITYCESAGIGVMAKQFISAQNIDAPRAIINSTSAAEAMMVLYLDKDKRLTYGNNGKEAVKNMYWDVLEEQFINAFSEAVEKSNPSKIFMRRVV